MHCAVYYSGILVQTQNQRKNWYNITKHVHTISKHTKPKENWYNITKHAHTISKHTKPKENWYNITKHAHTISKHTKTFSDCTYDISNGRYSISPNAFMFSEMVCVCFHSRHAHHFESTQWPQRQWRNIWVWSCNGWMGSSSHEADEVWNDMRSPNHRLHGLLPSTREQHYNLPSARNLPLVACRTEHFKHSFIPWAVREFDWLTVKIVIIIIMSAWLCAACCFKLFTSSHCSISAP